eukprot:CAMPEP_0197027642 /NCGR_PEP_ID=MMETSP1384-20130603/7514_1 /TAXON_ID=29189 /ORGANISM="Ammonia sp." /LENGTH=370 /DNA_ID=CAMNT_0042456513 /DNA_START=47 /DNA_END=1159 /DNA_ORIENTATION=+
MGQVHGILNIESCSPLAPAKEEQIEGAITSNSMSGSSPHTAVAATSKPAASCTGAAPRRSSESLMYRHGSMDKDHLYTTSVSWSSIASELHSDHDIDSDDLVTDVDFESIEEKREPQENEATPASADRTLKYQHMKLELMKLRQENSNLKKQNEELQLEAASKSKHHRKTTPIPQTRHEQNRPKLRNVATWSVADRKKEYEALSPLVCPLPQLVKFPEVPPIALRSARCRSASFMHSVADSDGHECDDGELVMECAVIQRFMQALTWYHECHGDDEILMKQIRAEKYGYGLIRDYHHILTKHLKSSHAKMVRRELRKNGTQCKNVKSCKACQRRKKQRVQHREGHIPFYIECIESVHCYFLHNINISKRV